jgi:hypothetical protein
MQNSPQPRQSHEISDPGTSLKRTVVTSIDWKRHGALPIVIAVASLAFLAMIAVIVAGVNRQDPPMFSPSVVAENTPPPVPGQPTVFTIDATAQEEWRFFSLRRGVILERPGALDWDLAFRRFQVMTNSGTGFFGSGGAIDLGLVPFEQTQTLPSTGYVTNTVRSDTTNAAIQDWYDYSYFSHLLTPKPNVYAIRTADGGYAKFQFVGYYCPGVAAGCVTFRYQLQDIHQLAE